MKSVAETQKNIDALAAMSETWGFYAHVLRPKDIVLDGKFTLPERRAIVAILEGHDGYASE